MQFEWDENKNYINIEKHNISFEDATYIWLDKNSFDIYDEKHSSLEEHRWIKFGILKSSLIACVVYTEINKNKCRIISVFSDKKIERMYYEQNS